MSDKNSDFSKIEDFSESSHRVRRNLLIFSTISLFVSLSNAKFSKINILGSEIEGINSLSIYFMLLVILLYHWLHFSWLAYEHYQYNIVALSAIPADEKHDLTWDEIKVDKKDSWNLYLWWRRNSDDFNKKLERIKKLINDGDSKDKIDLEQFESHFKSLTKIKYSLEKFDKCYKNYAKTARFRWLIIEIKFPIALGLLSIVLNLIHIVDMFY